MVHTQISCTGGDKRGDELWDFWWGEARNFQNQKWKAAVYKGDSVGFLLKNKKMQETDWLQTLGQINCFKKTSDFLHLAPPTVLISNVLCIWGSFLFFLRDPFFPSFNVLLPIYMSSYALHNVLYIHCEFISSTNSELPIATTLTKTMPTQRIWPIQW